MYYYNNIIIYIIHFVDMIKIIIIIIIIILMMDIDIFIFLFIIFLQSICCM